MRTRVVGINDPGPVWKNVGEKKRRVGRREETVKRRGGPDPPVSTHVKRGLLSTLSLSLSLRRFEKNTVEANHYGGATTDHFTLTE